MYRIKSITTIMTNNRGATGKRIFHYSDFPALFSIFNQQSIKVSNEHYFAYGRQMSHAIQVNNNYTYAKKMMWKIADFYKVSYQFLVQWTCHFRNIKDKKCLSWATSNIQHASNLEIFSSIYRFFPFSLPLRKRTGFFVCFFRNAHVTHSRWLYPIGMFVGSCSFR